MTLLHIFFSIKCFIKASGKSKLKPEFSLWKLNVKEEEKDRHPSLCERIDEMCVSYVCQTSQTYLISSTSLNQCFIGLQFQQQRQLKKQQLQKQQLLQK